MDINFPSLETERLFLRAFTNDDLDFVFQHFSNPEVHRYLLDNEPISTREQAQKIIEFFAQTEDKTHHRWLIVRTSDDLAIGTCGFHKWQQQHHRIEIGYDLQPSARNQGFMTEALTAMLSFCFEQMKVNRIEALIHPENLDSIRLIENLGFQKEGVLRDYFRRADRYYDHCLYSLLKSQWSQE